MISHRPATPPLAVRTRSHAIEATRGGQKLSALARMGLERVPVEVAVDQEGRLRRIVVTADLSVAAA